jgi:hypothetical protein
MIVNNVMDVKMQQGNVSRKATKIIRGNFPNAKHENVQRNYERIRKSSIIKILEDSEGKSQLPYDVLVMSL